MLLVAIGAAAALWLTKPSTPPATVAISAPPAATAPEPAPADAPIETPRTTEFARLAPAPLASEPDPGSTASNPAPSAGPAPAAPASLEDVVSRVLPAVATIEVTHARGTGFFIKPDTVLTNAHVVEGETSAKLLVGAMTYTARVASVNTGFDLAVLQVANANPQQATLTLGSMNSVRVGEEVVAVGSALGVLSNTVTRGIVSAFRKAGNTMLIQTDAAINPGNSGGPLVNRAGVVIGVNSIGMTRGAGEGLAFAVAIDHAAALLNGQTTLTAETPLTNLRQQMTGIVSTADATRAQGEQQFARELDAAAHMADAIDDYWNRYAGSCVVHATPGGDRPWFAALEPRGVEIGQSTRWDCGDWLATVREKATDVQAHVRQASEAARRSGVYPGTLRDIRKRHRLDAAGW